MVDVVLMAIRMRGLDGIEATRRLTTTEDAGAGGPGPPKVLILTTFDLDEYVYEALRAGASGFLLKRTRPEDLIAGLRVVADGDALLAPSVTPPAHRRVHPFRARAQAGNHHPRCSHRARAAGTGPVGSGLSNGEIAGTLCVSEATVKSHIKRIFRKLEITDRAKAVVVSYETGLVQLSR